MSSFFWNFHLRCSRRWSASGVALPTRPSVACQCALHFISPVLAAGCMLGLASPNFVLFIDILPVTLWYCERLRTPRNGYCETISCFGVGACALFGTSVTLTCVVLHQKHGQIMFRCSILCVDCRHEYVHKSARYTSTHTRTECKTANISAQVLAGLVFAFSPPVASRHPCDVNAAA